MSKLNELRAALSAHTLEYNNLVDAREAANGEFSTEQRSRYDALRTELPNLQERVADAERRANSVRHEPRMERDERAAVSRFNVATAIQGHVQRQRGDALTVDDGLEREVGAELRSRAGVIDPTFVGGVVVPAHFGRETRALSWGAGSGSGKGTQAEEFDGTRVTTELQAVALAGQLGVDFRTGIVGAPYTEPKITSGVALQWISEGSALTRADPVTDKVSMTPHIAGAVTSISPILLQQAFAQEIVSQHLLRVAAAGLDHAILAGSGAGAEPEGIWTALTPATLGEPTWAEMLGLIEGIELDNVNVARLGFALSPSAKRKLRSTPKLSFGSPVTETVGDFIMESPNELAGYRAVSSTTIPTTGSPPSAAGILAGDFSECVCGVWEAASLSINALNETDWLRGQIGIRILMLCDVAVKRAQAFRSATIAI